MADNVSTGYFEYGGDIETHLGETQSELELPLFFRQVPKMSVGATALQSGKAECIVIA